MPSRNSLLMMIRWSRSPEDFRLIVLVEVMEVFHIDSLINDSLVLPDQGVQASLDDGDSLLGHLVVAVVPPDRSDESKDPVAGCGLVTQGLQDGSWQFVVDDT